MNRGCKPLNPFWSVNSLIATRVILMMLKEVDWTAYTLYSGNMARHQTVHSWPPHQFMMLSIWHQLVQLGRSLFFSPKRVWWLVVLYIVYLQCIHNYTYATVVYPLESITPFYIYISSNLFYLWSVVCLIRLFRYSFLYAIRDVFILKKNKQTKQSKWPFTSPLFVSTFLLSR